MALGIGVSVGWSQPVPDTILLPDSLGPLRPGYHLAFGSSTNNIYVASESSDIIVVDGETFQRIKRINTGTPVVGALLVSQHNKPYCSYPSQGRIGVIDCATNSVIGSIQVGNRPKLLCYSAGSDKLYCGDSINGKVTVIDCAADTVRKVISTGYSPTAMVYEATTNKVYTATRDAVLAVSCVTDSIVANLDAIKYVSGLCLNKRRQKLYAVGRRQKDNPDTIYVVSPQSDSVIAAMHWGWDIVPSLACNEATDRLYAVTANNPERIREYDCLGDTYIRSGYTPRYEGEAIACDTVHNRLFHISECELSIYDCVTFGAVARFGVGLSDPYPVLELDPARYRVMCASWSYPNGVGVLTVFDYKHDTTYRRGAAPLCGWTHKMCHNPATSRLYCGWGAGAGVVDEQTNRVVRQALQVSGNMVYSRTSNKFYYSFSYGPFGEQGGLGVVDGSSDSLIGVVELGDYRWQPFPCWSPVGNKVYCFASKGARWFIAVVDCSTDSVVWERDVYGHGRWFEYLDNGLMLCNHSDSLALIDPRTDSVLVDSSLAAGAVYAVTHTGDGEKFYIARRYPGRLEVRSSSSLKLLSTIDWPYFDWSGTLLTYSDTTRKLYWLVDDSVLAIDATGDTVTARMATSVRYDDVCLDHTGKYLFYTSRSDNTLRVYDTRSDSLLAVYPQLPFPPLRVMSNPDLGYIYVAYQDGVLAYSDALVFPRYDGHQERRV
jgi:DNA-binding beta-propeller fold protein YncE